MASTVESEQQSQHGLPPDLAQLPRWVAIALAMLLAAEVAHLLLAGHFAWTKVLKEIDGLVGIAYFGALFGIPACALWAGGHLKALRQRVLWVGLVAGVVLYVAMLVGAKSYPGGVTLAVQLVAAPVGASVLALFMMTAVRRVAARQPLPQWAWAYLALTVLISCLGLATEAALVNTAFLFPATWDFHAYRIDAVFGSVPALLGSAIWPRESWPYQLTLAMYSALSPFFYVAIALAMRLNAVRRLNLWATFVVPFVFGWVCYAWLPLSGPVYAFGSEQFPDRMPGAETIPATQVVIAPAFRNGMPSMHLSGAILVWMVCLALRVRWAVVLSAVLVLGTMWSTVALGEHYLIDLVVAIPGVAFLGVALIAPRLLAAGWPRAGAPWAAAAVFLIWMVALRAAPAWLAAQPSVVYLLTALGSVAAVLTLLRFVQEVGARGDTVMDTAAEAPKPGPVLRAPAWVVGLFVASGFAGLMYEVVYAKALAVTFGGTALAAYTVLTTYMGGMALGAWLGGRWADATTNPLRAYALCEAAIGIYAVATPQLFELIRMVYVQLSLDTPPDAPILTALRVSLGAACLGVPTLLMGATFPLMFKQLRQAGVTSHRAIAPLYGANVIGAAAGSLAAGYWVLPAVGRDGGTYVAAALSLLVALYAIAKGKEAGILAPADRPDPVVAAEAGANPATEVSRRIGATALLVLIVGGAVTLALEVYSIHMLAAVAGNSVYAFALMLAAFLAGLGLGASAGEFLMRRIPRMQLVGWAQCGVALSIALTALLWSGVPVYLANFASYPVRLDFTAREFIRALICALAMLPPTIFIGLSYPVAMSLATDWLSPRGGARGLGLASGLNTLGNILGVLIGGFWLLPQFGSRDTAFALALVALLLGAVALAQSNPPAATPDRDARGALVRWVPLGLALAALSLIPKQWNHDALSTGSNVYFAPQGWGKVIEVAESAEGGITSVARSDHGITTLLTNGKFQGNDAQGGEMIAQESFALFPLMHTDRRGSALVLGYGTGMSARVLHDAGFERIDIAELSRDIVKLADKHFASINHGVTSAPNVHMHYTDGRNFLLTQSRRFDVISIEISSIWFAGAANLYNREFYALAHERLTDEGVLQQWVQLHHITPLDIYHVLGSVRAEFRHVWLYVRGGQGVIVASNRDAAAAMPGMPQLELMTQAGKVTEKPGQLASHLVMSPAGIDHMLKKLDPEGRGLLSTDRNLYLEHSTPKGNVLGDVMDSNVRLLASFETEARAGHAPRPGTASP